MSEIFVEASRSYKVKIERGLLKRAGAELRAAFPNAKFAVVTDSTVAELYLETLQESLPERAPAFVFPAGEASKNLTVFGEILEFLAHEALTRSDVLLALGGGVTGDMAGFASACYLRGIDFVQLPTTLLAAVDSSVGGKTAVDLPQGQNLAGAFHQPALVLIDPDCFSSLSAATFAQGAAECIKHGALFDEVLFSRLARGNLQADIEEIVEKNIEYKAAAVKADEFDLGARQLLNFGHTFGHAVEKCSGFSVSHGEGVAIGLCLAARCSEKLLAALPGTLSRLEQALHANGLPTDCPFSAQMLCEAALSDKKRRGESIVLVLIEKIGRCRLQSFPIDELPEIMKLATGES